MTIQRGSVIKKRALRPFSYEEIIAIPVCTSRLIGNRSASVLSLIQQATFLDGVAMCVCVRERVNPRGCFYLKNLIGQSIRQSICLPHISVFNFLPHRLYYTPLQLPSNACLTCIGRQADSLYADGGAAKGQVLREERGKRIGEDKACGKRIGQDMPAKHKGCPKCPADKLKHTTSTQGHLCVSSDPRRVGGPGCEPTIITLKELR
jgi:hypothetical protein